MSLGATLLKRMLWTQDKKHGQPWSFFEWKPTTQPFLDRWTPMTRNSHTDTQLLNLVRIQECVLLTSPT